MIKNIMEGKRKGNTKVNTTQKIRKQNIKQKNKK